MEQVLLYWIHKWFWVLDILEPFTSMCGNVIKGWHVTVIILQIFLQGTASLVNTTPTLTQTTTLLEESRDAVDVSSHEMSAAFDSPTQHQDVQTPTPLHSGSLVGSVDRLNGGMEVHSPATLSFSDISPISPLSTPSTPDHQQALTKQNFGSGWKPGHFAKLLARSTLNC